MTPDQDRKKELQPGRVEFAKRKLEELNYSLSISSNGRIQFDYKGSIITLWCYTGWYSGKNIVDGRGVMNLIKQLK